jgi:site-specific DNA-methyltransferase (adenine-specific)
LTDPPYGINYRGRPYFFQQGTIPGDKTPEQALALLAEAIELLHPKLAPQAHLLIFTCWRQQRHVEDLVEKAGFTVRSSLIWVKDGHGVGDCKHGFGPAHECIVHASRGNAPIRNRNGDVFHHPRVKPHVHPTQKPLGLLAELVKATIEPGQLVCDPFAGAASTLVAATATGRNAWGCELNPDWHNAGLERLRNPQAELALETGDDKEQAP